MKKSTVIGGAAGTLAAVVGLVAAVCLPVVGLVAGAVVVHGAVAATMGTAATVALSAAGAVGGLVLGRLAAPVAAFAALGLGAAVGGAVKLAGAGIEKFAGLFSRKPKPAASQKAHHNNAPRTLVENGKSRFAERFSGLSLVSKFDDAGQQPANENKTTPAAKPALQNKNTGYRR